MKIIKESDFISLSLNACIVSVYGYYQLVYKHFAKLCAKPSEKLPKYLGGKGHVSNKKRQQMAWLYRTYLHRAEGAGGSRRLNENDAVPGGISKQEQKGNKSGVKKLTDV